MSASASVCRCGVQLRAHVGVCIALCSSASWPWHLHVFHFSVSLHVCVCVCEVGVSQGQNELMLNIPYWFYCNSFLILSLFNFISFRLVGMEMRPVLFFPPFFFCLCKLQRSPRAFRTRLPRWPCVVCLKFYFPPLPAFPSWLQGRGEGAGKPPEGSGRSHEAAAVAKRDLGEEEEEEGEE